MSNSLIDLNVNKKCLAKYSDINSFSFTNWNCRYKLTSALVVDPLYLQHGYSNSTIDYRHWGVPLSRRFRSLKLWFVFRCYGISGLQAYIRHHLRLAKKFEALVRKDSRFELCHKVIVSDIICYNFNVYLNFNFYGSRFNIN